MSAEELVQAGEVEAALSDLQQRVRTHPADSELRIFLFQLMAVLGQWKRALTQLEVIQDLDNSTWPLVHAYREAMVVRPSLLDEALTSSSTIGPVAWTYTTRRWKFEN